MGLAGLLVAAQGLQAQRSPNIGYVYPAGGRQGTSFSAAISGRFLDGATNVIISGTGVTATVVSYTKPLNGKELNLLRDRLKYLQQGLSAAKETDSLISVMSELDTNQVRQLSRAALEKEHAEIKQKLANPKNQRPPNPQLGEDLTLSITVGPQAAPGDRELRLMTAAGLSNPRTFRVGNLAEFSKPPEISLSGPRNANRPRSQGRPAAGPGTSERRTISLPCVVNGQIMPGAVDRYWFSAQRGQRLVVAASARDLIPYLADAVPGWFQATLALLDEKGKELAYADDFLFNPDPVLYYEIPRDSEYALEIKDAIYRGREDFVYRITVGELPFVTTIFPLGGQAGKPTTLELQGWNLPTNSLTMDATDKTPGVYPILVHQRQMVSNPALFAVDALPECLELEPNDQPKNAQPITLPVTVNGRIAQPNDTDVFSFTGQAGQEIVAEVIARRLNSPLDSSLRLTDATGQQIAFNDDQEDQGAGLTTHHADSRLSLALPATGTYYLHLGDTQGKGGPAYAYRLRIGPPEPNFALRVVPASVNVRAGGTASLTVYALRKDGFTNEITLVLKDAPTGFTLSGAKVPGNTNQARITLKAPREPLSEPVSISLEGRATLLGQKVTRPAVPAEDMMQAFAYRHLVPAQGLEVAVIERARPAPPTTKPAQPPATPPPPEKPKSP